jgi:hypothetical protein
VRGGLTQCAHDGIPLAVGAALGLVAMLVIVVRRWGRPTQARLLGVLAGAVLVTAVSEIWLGLHANMRNIAARTAGGPGTFRQTFDLGAGAWLLLAAAVAALVSVQLLLIPARSAPPPPDPGHYQPGPGDPNRPPG